MFSRIGHWIKKRWPIDTLMHILMVEEMPGGASYAYIFGSSVMLAFFLQAVTGIWQLIYFVPVVDHAYDSLSYFRTEVPFGWLIHGLHYWGASAMIVLMGIHMSQVFLWGAYKEPRQLTWLIGAVQMVLTMSMGFTGPILPWDERGYWEAEVGTSIAGTVPFLGDLIKRLLQGGGELGQLALSRFFILHVAILPGILLGVISLHMVAYRQFGIAGPWNPDKRKRIGWFWPDQIFKDGLIFMIIFLLLIGLAAYSPPPIMGAADPLDTSYVPKPEWYFLFIYQSLKAFQGVLEPVGTVGIPLAGFLLLIFLPFFDHNPERNPARRPLALAGYLAIVIWVVWLGIAGYSSKGTEASPPASPAAAPAAVSSPIPPPEKIAGSADQGAQLFQSLSCISCHRINGAGGTVGPDLSSGVLRGKSRERLITQIRDPKKNDPTSIMPAFNSLSDQQVNELVDYLLALESGGGSASTPFPAGPPPVNSGAPSVAPSPSSSSEKIIGPSAPPGPAAAVIGSLERGEGTFKNICEACHGFKGTDKIPNPGSTDGTVPPLNPIDRELFNQDPQTFANNIDRYIQHGSNPEGSHPALHMSSFGDSNTLSQAAIANVEAYVMQLNRVDRAKLIHPGISPGIFFWAAVIVFLIAVAWMGFWIRKKK